MSEKEDRFLLKEIQECSSHHWQFVRGLEAALDVVIGAKSVKEAKSVLHKLIDQETDQGWSLVQQELAKREEMGLSPL